MKGFRHWLLLAVLLLMPSGAVHADDGSPADRIIIGQNFTLSSGETVNGNLIVIAGETTVEESATVHGDLVVLGASLRLDGEAKGSAIVIGGSASLGETAAVGTDLVALGGSFERAEGARIAGDIITSASISVERLPNATVGHMPNLPPTADIHLDYGPLGTVAGVFFQSIGLAALAMLLTAFLHPQVDRVGQAALAQPFASGSIGLLTVFLAPLAIVIMAVTLVLIPLALAAVMLLILAWLFGIVALGQVVGERLAQSLHRTWEPVVTAGLGAFVLGLVLSTSTQIPCVGWLASVLIGLIGLGAAAITLFGTRAYVPLGTSVVPPPDATHGIGSPPAPA